MAHNTALNRKWCSGFAFVILTIALAVGFTACTFDSSALSRLEDDVVLIGGGDADAFDPEIGFMDVQDARPDIATDTGSDAEVRDTSDIDIEVALDAPADTASDATPDGDETGDDVEVGFDAEIEVGDTTEVDAIADVGSDAPTDVVVEDVTTDAPAETEGDTELDSADSSDTIDASADTFGCERDRDCGWGQICWVGECLDNQACNPFAVSASSGTWITWYPATGPSVSERASGSSVWDESPPGACAVAVSAIDCQCLTHFGASSCGALPGGGWGCVHNDDHIP